MQDFKETCSFEIFQGGDGRGSFEPNIYLSRSTSEIMVRSAPSNMFKPSSKYILQTFPIRRHFSWILFVMCVSCLSCCLVCSLRPCGHLLERADLLVLLCVNFSCVFVTFSYGVLGQVWYLIVYIPDRCLLPYFLSKPQVPPLESPIKRHELTQLCFFLNKN